ncbi:hypothetical protein ACFXG4_31955 [Nocardia sp. NPDC059246]|uniref:hypothetical protein n=1 Tax=unclassified Nocardia TaxID=2637762 RepID=UPI0036CDC7A3
MDRSTPSSRATARIPTASIPSPSITVSVAATIPARVSWNKTHAVDIGVRHAIERIYFDQLTVLEQRTT